MNRAQKAGGTRLLRSLALACSLAGLVALACASGPKSDGEPAGRSAADRAEARRLLGDAREFLAQDRSDAALRATGRGLRANPRDPGLLRLRAHLLESSGDADKTDKTDKAKRFRSRADAIDPPPGPLPIGAHAADATTLSVFLIPPPDLRGADRKRVPASWPDGALASTFVARVRERLPKAQIALASPSDFDTSRKALLASRATQNTSAGKGEVLTLRVDRSFFASTRKDGAFAVAWLRSGRASAASREAHIDVHRYVLDSLVADTADLRSEALFRALEEVLDRLETQPIENVASASIAAWPAGVVRVLFPKVARRALKASTQGRQFLADGELAQAVDAFSRAVLIDPGDPDARSLYDDSKASLALSEALEGKRDKGKSRPASLRERAPQLSKAARARLEERLQSAREERGRLAAALRVLQRRNAAPSAATLRDLADARGEIGDVARELLPQLGHRDARVRLALTPEGSVLARFYFPAAAQGEAQALRPESLVLREDDADADGRPERWTAFRGGLATTYWEDRSGDGRPEVRAELAEAGGALERVEVDRNHDGRPEQRMRYAAGRIVEEARDRDGDGRYEVFDHFSPTGTLLMRGEDRDGDGRVDLRSYFEDGRLVRRERLLGPR